MLAPVSDVSAVTMKEKYTKRYQKLLKKCKKQFKYDGSQAEMNQNAADEYELWDKELNVAYKEVYKSLNAAKQKELKKSERNWIRKKEKQARKDASDWEGGSGYPCVYYGSLTSLTKKRIKWLIGNYM